MKHILSLKSLFFVAILFLAQGAKPQVTTNPTPALANSSAQIIFDASKGNAGLKNYTGDVYAHIGVITDKSTSGSDWKYVKAEWSTNLPACKLSRSTETGKENIYTLNLQPSIRSFFGVPDGEQIKQIAVVFRNADGSKTGKTASGGDIFIDVFTSQIALKLEQPSDGATYLVGDNVPIVATATADKIDLFVDNALLSTSTNGSLDYTLVPTSAKKYDIKVVATQGIVEASESLSINVVAAPEVEALPAGVRKGLTILDGKATFVLEAPNKKYAILLGSFNKYTSSDAFVMKKTPDGKMFWITLDTLSNNVDYSYQYWVDGSVKIADPYSTLVLDPSNDQYITDETYPKKPVYPTGMTSGIVSSFRMNPAEYAWRVDNFTPVDKSALNIYEMHLRDFLARHDYKTLADTIGYFKRLGINAIELMPINEFEGNNSWGYNPSFYFALDKYYGPANDLRAFVDACHEQGIAVIIDLVLNHSFSQSPFVQLYYNSTTSKVTSDNPWYNVDSPNTAYSWGYDFNHESAYTQALVDSVNAYWMDQFKIDGFRFDFTKGFTQKSGDGWAYDASRIAILKRMNNEIVKRNPGAIVILEHLTDNSEETELANAGILLWGNMNNNSCEAAMGFHESGKSDLTGTSYQDRGWSLPSLVGYMESHDEERIGYKEKMWGRVSGSYNVKDAAVANRRHAALATVFMSVPGPKMVWQWGELGYNYSINTCENGSVNNDCRTNPKPSFWNKYTDTPENQSNLELRKAYADILNLRNESSVFSTTNFTPDLWSSVKSVKLVGADMTAITVANLDVEERTFETSVNGTGYYYSQTAKDSVAIVNGKISLAMAPGDYHILTSKRLFTPLKLELESPIDGTEIELGNSINISAHSEAEEVTLYVNGTEVASGNGAVDHNYTPLNAGTYFIKAIAISGKDTETRTATITVKSIPVIISISSPVNNAEYTVGDEVHIAATANSTSISLKINNEQVATGTSIINYTYKPETSGTVNITVSASNLSQTSDSTISIKVKPKMAEGKFGPNPILKGNVLKCNVRTDSSETVQVYVFSISGKLVLKKNCQVVAGIDNIIEIPTGSNGFAHGLYVVKITGSFVNLSEKIVVL